MRGDRQSGDRWEVRRETALATIAVCALIPLIVFVAIRTYVAVSQVRSLVPDVGKSVVAQTLFSLDGYEVIGLSDDGNVLSLGTDDEIDEAWNALDTRMYEAGWRIVDDGAISAIGEGSATSDSTLVRTYERGEGESCSYALASITDLGDQRVLLIQVY